MITIQLLLVILALVCFLIATFGVNVKFNPTALGLFFWLLSQVIRA